MKKQLNKGSSTTQYIIIIVLIGLALVPGFFFLGQQIIDNFKYFQSGLQGAQTNSLSSALKDSISNETTKAGDLGGNPDDPKYECYESKCSIDYGDFILNGLPPNFGDLVQVSGNSGGTDKIADLLKQIANYLEAEGEVDQANSVRYLANLSHNIASIERLFEAKIEACSNNETCLRNLENTKIGDIPGYDYSVYGFDPDTTYREMTMNIGLGQAYEHLYGQGLSADNVSREAVVTFGKIKDDSNMSASVRGLIQELYWDIGVMSERVANLGYQLVTAHEDGQTHNTFDPVTGEKTNPAYENGYDEFVNSNASEITDFDAALICAFKKGIDSGVKCH
ncbi:MAG: hypothetical protein AB1782_07125 [Cyanobacteriota bacterium]